MFVHYSGLVMEGFKSLEEGASVEFEVVQGEKGPQAVNMLYLILQKEVVKNMSGEDRRKQILEILKNDYHIQNPAAAVHYRIEFIQNVLILMTDADAPSDLSPASFMEEKISLVGSDNTAVYRP